MSDSFSMLEEIKRRKRRSVGAVLSYVLVGAVVVLVSSLATITRDTTKVYYSIWISFGSLYSKTHNRRCCIQKYATDRYDPDREGFIVNNAHLI